VPRPQGPASCSTDKSFEIIRSLIDEIRLVPEDGALKIELRGELAGILALASESTKARGLSTTGLAEQIKMVADLPPIIKTQSGAVTPQGIGSAFSLSEDCSAVLALSRTRRAGCRRCRKRHPGQRLCTTLCRSAGRDEGMVAAVEQRDWRDGHAAVAGTVV
jgi:hypothetical protein